MSLGFWKKLKADLSLAGRGIFVLAPMADVTDAAFRRVIAKYGKPDVLWTEFVSADGLALAPDLPAGPGRRGSGRNKLLKNLEYTEEERPIVAQFFTSNLAHMESAARLAKELGFDGVDINMGCPDRSVEKQGAGAVLMKDANRARELIRAAKRGAGDLPVSIKIRLGYNRVAIEEWLPEVLEEEPAVITIHARTRKEMSKTSARWEFVKRAVEIRDAFALRHAQGKNEQTIIFGNGDVENIEDAENKIRETGCDGVMFGRAIFGNPWLFANSTPSVEEKLDVLIEHTKLFEKLLGNPPALPTGRQAGGKNFAVMKKHFKAYIHGFPGVVELRQKLMKTENAKEVEGVVAKFLKGE